MTATFIHRVIYRTPDGAREWTYATATITDTETATPAIRETADREAASTDPDLVFVEHQVRNPYDEADAQEVTEQP